MEMASSKKSKFNGLACKANYSATSNNIKLVHLPLVGGLLFWYSKDETGQGPAALPGPSSLYQM